MHPSPSSQFGQRLAAALRRLGLHVQPKTIEQVRASPRFRVSYDANRCSVPAAYASTLLTLKVYPDRLCLYHHDKLVARHERCYDRHKDIEDPDHPKALLEQRHNAREHKLLGRFLALSPKAEAEAYYQALAERRLNPRHCLCRRSWP